MLNNFVMGNNQYSKMRLRYPIGILEDDIPLSVPSGKFVICKVCGGAVFDDTCTLCATAYNYKGEIMPRYKLRQGTPDYKLTPFFCFERAR